jgi:hypothetical protein
MPALQALSGTAASAAGAAAAAAAAAAGRGGGGGGGLLSSVLTAMREAECVLLCVSNEYAASAACTCECELAIKGRYAVYLLY